jgi:HEAT repeat protein
LGKIGDARAVEPLIQALEHEGLFWHAAEALGEIGDTRAVEPLIKVLSDDEYYVRNYTKETLRKLGHEVE